MTHLFSKLAICGTGILSILSVLFGGFDSLAETLIFMMVADYILGVVSAIYHKEISSQIGFKGLMKKVAILLCVFVAVEVNTLMPDVPIRTIVISFYIANEGISIMENLAKIIPIPEKLKAFFLQLREEKKNE